MKSFADTLLWPVEIILYDTTEDIHIINIIYTVMNWTESHRVTDTDGGNRRHFHNLADLLKSARLAGRAGDSRRLQHGLAGSPLACCSSQASCLQLSDILKGHQKLLVDPTKFQSPTICFPHWQQKWWSRDGERCDSVRRNRSVEADQASHFSPLLKGNQGWDPSWPVRYVFIVQS